MEQATKMLNALNELSDAEWEKQSEVVGKKADEIYKDAGTYFEQALKIQPENTDPMTILFQIYSKLKMTEQAEAMNKKLVEKLGPNWMDN
ncbi:tetratricopeptide repeat protein [Algoriphagus boritolerans]|uniref:tetratricopeptide repeat protein n=1 Tax=Algoriphagus boritolerans TaxID=308111 RepID=UPI002FCDE451